METSTSSQIVKQITTEIDPICAKTKPIFLSYSGNDKDFLRRLYDALLNANHDPFLDMYSLAPGEHFPTYLIQTLKACKLGVVVLSPHFLTSKWPMRELHILHTSPSSPKILPLFYKVHPNDLKRSSPRFAEWQAAWREIAEKDPSLATFSQLESAVVQLPKIQGVVHDHDTHGIMGEDDYIKEVVRHVSCIIRPLLRYDTSNLTGHERLAKEVDEIFWRSRSPAQETACMVGFHGIAGQGKTTVCKLMVNNYASIYAGRCALIEFPTFDCNKKAVVSQCKKALNQLITSTYSKTTIDRLHDFDECLELMKRHVSSLDVFIALDNIWDTCLDFAQRILDVGFSSTSKILVTSRSRQVLINLLKGRRHVMSLPSVTSEEARRMFVKCFNRNKLSDHVQLQDAQVDDVIQSYLFSNGAHHPLVISALGASLGRSAGEDQSAWKQYIHALSAARDMDDDVYKAIKINFDSIPPKRRNIFLDVTLIYIPNVQGFEVKRYNENLKQKSLLHVWLSALYQEMTEWEIRKTLIKLAYDGLLEFEESGGVHVHDLYRDLATREASASGNFLLADHTTSDDCVRSGVKKLSESKEAGRIVLLQTQTEVLRGYDMPIIEGVHLLSSCNAEMCALEAMPRLRVLKLHRGNKLSWLDLSGNQLSAWVDLSWLDLTYGRVHEGFFCDDIGKLSKLCFVRLFRLWIEGENQGIMCLDGLVNLRVMVMQDILKLQEISGLGSLVNLECMILHRVPDLRKVGDISCCSRLQDVQFHGCPRLTQVEGLGVLPNLQTLNCGIPELYKLEKLYDQSQMSSVEELNVYGIMKVKRSKDPQGMELEGYYDVKVELQNLHNLRNLSIDYDRGHPYGMHEVRRLCFDGSVSLRELVVEGMKHLEEISGLGNLRNVESMTLSDLPELREVINSGGINSSFSVLRTLQCEMHTLELLIQDQTSDMSSLRELIVLAPMPMFSIINWAPPVTSKQTSVQPLLPPVRIKAPAMKVQSQVPKPPVRKAPKINVRSKVPKPPVRARRPALTFDDLVSKGLCSLKTFHIESW